MLRTSCPKCGSRGLTFETDSTGAYKVCLYCGYTKYLDSKADMPKMSSKGALTIR